MYCDRAVRAVSTYRGGASQLCATARVAETADAGLDVATGGRDRTRRPLRDLARTIGCTRRRAGFGVTAQPDERLPQCTHRRKIAPGSHHIP